MPDRPRPVVLTHGLWLGAWSLVPLARHLTAQGLEVHRFGYSSRHSTAAEHAKRLAAFAADFGPVDLVAHSLGGIVALHACGLLPQPAGKAVLIGSPIGGSRAARRFAGWPGGPSMLGLAAEDLVRPAPAPPSHWAVGMIAGRVRLGLGVLAGGGRFAGDGTVALEETREDWLADHLVVAESHTSLQLSRRVARQVAAFLRKGAFDPDPDPGK